VALWAALNSLSSPGSSAYFHNYQNDRGYLQWRQEAEREATNNPAVAAKLQQLDTQLAQMADQPRNPTAAPPVQPSPSPSGGSGTIWVVLFIGIAILALLWLWRRRHAPALLPLRPVPALPAAQQRGFASA
jgi:MYXO-CTERM domain-containing protein